MPAMRSFSFAFALLALLASRPAAAAVTLRPFGVLSGPMVRLSDLFDGVGAAGERVLGPGPQPGERITVPAAQLAAIAEQFGVDWHPNSADEQAILERPGRPLRRDEVTQALAAALAAAGAPANASVTLSGFSAPEVPPGAAVSVRVEQLDYDPASGRFSTMIAIEATGMDRIEMPVSGRVERMAQVLVASHFLMPGEIVGPEDLRQAEVPASSISGAVATHLAEASGLEVLHAVGAGEPVPLEDLVPPPMVQRGQRVLIALAAPGLALTEQGQALEGGAKGAMIRVLNPVSRAVLQATVTGPGVVAVAAGSLPLTGPGGSARHGYPEYAAQ